MAKDTTQYLFQGETFKKGRLVWAIVAAYIKRENATYSMLESAFSSVFSGSKRDVFVSKEKYDALFNNSNDAENRYFINDTEILTTDDGKQVYVSNQWGIFNIEAFLQCSRGLGFEIKPFNAELPPEKLSLSSRNLNNENLKIMPAPLNQIFYGPPGTGKTYHTIEAAVKAAENARYSKILAKTTDEEERRQLFLEEYNGLIAEKRIRFVTFHQSFGYEDFVEGLRAQSDNEGNLSYPIKDGVFKSIVEDAKSTSYRKAFDVKQDAAIWKISIDGTGKTETSEYCLKNGLAAIGWGETGDLLSEQREDNEYYKNLGSNEKSSLSKFSARVAVGDLLLCIGSKRTVQAVGVVSGEYRFAPEGTANYKHYSHQLAVNWLVTDINVDFHALNGGVNFTQKTIYELYRFSIADVFNLLKMEKISIGAEDPLPQPNDNYVLIIDEINRGNISKIFGELITLIEPSKRAGQKEVIELTLPCSGKTFSVPNNLYIIGTMNTADRSLAMMDTALRRRFDFVEMMPNPKELKNAQVKGINLTSLLETLNQRIEILYDREHTLGHAFFMPVKKCIDADNETEAFNALVGVFQHKIIPLLQEYFFEDWQKIRLVLGDNQRDKGVQFVEETLLNKKALVDLFGQGFELDNFGDAPKQCRLKPFNNLVWKDKNAYIGMYPQEMTKNENAHQENEIDVNLNLHETTAEGA